MKRTRSCDANVEHTIHTFVCTRALRGRNGAERETRMKVSHNISYPLSGGRWAAAEESPHSPKKKIRRVVFWRWLSGGPQPKIGGRSGQNGHFLEGFPTKFVCEPFDEKNCINILQLIFQFHMKLVCKIDNMIWFKCNFAVGQVHLRTFLIWNLLNICEFISDFHDHCNRRMSGQQSKT